MGIREISVCVREWRVIKRERTRTYVLSETGDNGKASWKKTKQTKTHTWMDMLSNLANFEEMLKLFHCAWSQSAPSFLVLVSLREKFCLFPWEHKHMCACTPEIHAYLLNLLLCEQCFSLSDHDLVWKYIDWVLEKDEELGVKVCLLQPFDWLVLLIL